MKVLVIKTSSLGDILHTLPALTDAGQKIPGIRFDWVVEEAFAELPSWHPLVDKVIPVALRRWRKQPLDAWRSGEWQAFRQQLQAEKYDYVIDAQGLMKSALVTFFARGLRCGLDAKSAWEPLASLVYQRKLAVVPEQHAVVRVRQLFALALGYDVPISAPDYGLDLSALRGEPTTENYVVFLHGTTWPSKHYPEEYWQQLAKQISAAGYVIKLPWGNAIEYERAQHIAQNVASAEVLPKLNLKAIAHVLANAQAAVAVDTGLGHLAAALRVPTISLYGPTDPKLTGTVGVDQIHLPADFACVPCLKPTCTYEGVRDVEPACFANLQPSLIAQRLLTLLAEKRNDE